MSEINESESSSEILKNKKRKTIDRRNMRIPEMNDEHFEPEDLNVILFNRL